MSDDKSLMVPAGHHSPFEAIRRRNAAGNEFWSSRDFARVLGTPTTATSSRSCRRLGWLVSTARSGSRIISLTSSAGHRGGNVVGVWLGRRPLGMRVTSSNSPRNVVSKNWRKPAKPSSGWVPRLGAKATVAGHSRTSPSSLASCRIVLSRAPKVCHSIAQANGLGQLRQHVQSPGGA